MAGIIISPFLAALFISIESIQNLSTRHAPPAWWTLLILGVVILVKESLSRYVHSIGVSIQSTAVRADAFHHRSDAITSVVALVGDDGYEIALLLPERHDTWCLVRLQKSYSHAPSFRL